MSASGAQPAQYGYDKRGNLVQATSGAASPTQYTYDAADRVSGATLSDGTPIRYTYDDQGRRVSQSVGVPFSSNVGQTTTNYLWDTASPYGDVAAETDSSGVVQASYATGNGDVLAQTQGGTASYYLPDGQGSVRGLADPNGSVTDSYRYDAFGAILGSQGTTTNPYRYTGQRYDASTQLYQLRARSYDPATGRFLTRDTVLQPYLPAELGRYGYAQENPINDADPSGHTTVAVESGSGGGAAIEYAALLWQDFVWSVRVAAIGAATSCVTIRDASILIAAVNDGPGVLALKQLDPGEPPLCIIPVLVYPRVSTRGKTTNTIWQHIKDAQAGQGSVPFNEPMLLVYLKNDVQAKANRKAACAPSRFTPGAPPNTTCDEYPFASTYTSIWLGGTNISVRGVPLSEQRVQGGIITKFLGRNNVLDGQPYACVPEP